MLWFPPKAVPSIGRKQPFCMVTIDKIVVYLSSLFMVSLHFSLVRPFDDGPALEETRSGWYFYLFHCGQAGEC